MDLNSGSIIFVNKFKTCVKVDKPINVSSIKFSDKKGNVIVTEDYGVVLNSDESAEKFIQERYKYWTDTLGMDLVMAPYKNETITEFEIRKVFNLVAKQSGVLPKFILRRTRSTPIIEARRIGINICLSYGLSENIIGKAIGYDRTTIIHHRDKFFDLCETEDGYEDKYFDILKAIKYKVNGKFKSDGSGKKESNGLND